MAGLVPAVTVVSHFTAAVQLLVAVTLVGFDLARAEWFSIKTKRVIKMRCATAVLDYPLICRRMFGIFFVTAMFRSLLQDRLGSGRRRH
jgi:hypothetical protein